MLRLLPSLAGMTMMATAALAAPPDRIDAQARLVHCAAQTCLRVTGQREAVSAPVTLAGHAVAVTGGRRWQATLPLAFVRLWSPPASRTISVVIGDGVARREDSAPLPIGLLNDSNELALLDVRTSGVERYVGGR